MANIFLDGMEDGSLTSFTSYTSGYEASTSKKRTGAYSLFSPRAEGGYASIIFPAAKTELFGRFGFYPTTATGDDYGGIWRFYDASLNIMATIAYDKTNAKFLFYRGSTSQLFCESATNSAPLDSWTCVEFRLKVDNSSGVAQLKINTTATSEYTGDTQEGATAEMASIRLGAPSSGWIPQKYFDDIVINDATGSFNNSWPGAGGIRVMVLSGAGSNTDLTPSTGSNYACLDEIPASDTDYVSGSTADNYDLYTLDTSNIPASCTVNAVKWSARAKVSEDAANITPVIRSESTTEQQSDISLSTSYVVKSLIMDADPIDDAAWDRDKIVALEIGVAVG